MDKKIDALVDSTTEKLTLAGVGVNGIVVCDKSGLVLTTKDVSCSSGPIAHLAELAASLTGRRTTVCLEHNENQVLISQTDKAFIAVYTINAV